MALSTEERHVHCKHLTQGGSNKMYLEQKLNTSIYSSKYQTSCYQYSESWKHRSNNILAYSCSNDRQSQVVRVQQVRQHQKVYVASVTGQQYNWVLLNGMLQLKNKTRTNNIAPIFAEQLLKFANTDLHVASDKQKVICWCGWFLYPRTFHTFSAWSRRKFGAVASRIATCDL